LQAVLNPYRTKLPGCVYKISEEKNMRELYRGINKFRRGYQPRNNFVKDENGDQLADSHNILNRWKNNFSQLFIECA
jgi:hypothetical protein